MFARSDFYFEMQLPLIIIHITCISLSLRQTSAPIHMTGVLGVLGTQETFCILIAGLLERNTERTRMSPRGGVNRRFKTFTSGLTNVK
jgi:hypothetical protein